MSDQSAETTDIEPLVLQAEQALSAGEHDDAYRLATEAREHPAARQSQQARAALVLAAAALRFGSPDLAREHLRDATENGASFEDLGKVRGEIARYERADDAASDGVQGTDETSAIIRAAREANAAGAPEQAVEILRPIWDTTQSDEAQLPDASYVMAQALLAMNQPDDAMQYAEWARSNGHGEAQALIDDIARLRDALLASTDGTQVSEQKAVFAAAEDAYNRKDFATAMDLYSSVYESPALSPRGRASCAFNIAQCNRHLSNLDLARAWYEEYLRIDPGSQYAAEVAQHLENFEALAHLTEALPVE